MRLKISYEYKSQESEEVVVQFEEGGEVALHNGLRHHVHEPEHIVCVVLVRHASRARRARGGRSAHAAHEQQRVVARRVVLAARHVRVRPALERGDEQRRDFGLEQPWQQLRLQPRVALRIVLYCSQTICQRALFGCDKRIHLQMQIIMFLYNTRIVQ